MKQRKLINKSLTQFIVCVSILLLLATPLFYWLTKNFYAEDMIDIIEAIQKGQPIPTLDLEEDILHGILIQFSLITAVLGIAIILTMRFISQRLWRNFDQTLETIETFRLENNTVPTLPKSEIAEFDRLNNVLNELMKSSIQSYKIQKEFTENASHELQTPLAIIQTKLDILLQQPDITKEQAVIIQDIYQTTTRLSRLNRNLLLLAKMENRQFSQTESIDVIQVLQDLSPYLESLTDGIGLIRDFQRPSLKINANRSLLESMINNLVANAVRYNKKGGEICISTDNKSLTVSNTSDSKALDENVIFNRFYRSSRGKAGTGLGLSIVRAVCLYHHWKIQYEYCDNHHIFHIVFL